MNKIRNCCNIFTHRVNRQKINALSLHNSRTDYRLTIRRIWSAQPLLRYNNRDLRKISSLRVKMSLYCLVLRVFLSAKTLLCLWIIHIELFNLWCRETYIHALRSFRNFWPYFYETWYTRVFDDTFFNSEVKNSKFKMADPI